MSADHSIDSDRMEYKMDGANGGGSYPTAYEIYEEKLNECQNQVKNLKDKIEIIRDEKFHCMRKYFTNDKYYNSLTARGNDITRVESHSNSRSDPDNSNTHTNTKNDNNGNTNPNKNNNNNNSNNSNTNKNGKNNKQQSNNGGSNSSGNNNTSNNNKGNNNDNSGNGNTLSKADVEAKLKRELSMKLKIRLSGHGNKVYAIDWHKDNKQLISAARDAKCMIWDVETGYRKTAFNLDTEFTMDCKFSPNCSIVACGGLDDTLSIYKLTDDMHGFVDIAPSAKLQEHGGYISSIAFVDDNRVLTASGDQTLILWDINKEQVHDIYGSHWADVMSVSVRPDHPNIFVSGSTDYTCRVWDTRLPNNSNPRKLSAEQGTNNNNNNNTSNAINVATMNNNSSNTNNTDNKSINNDSNTDNNSSNNNSNNNNSSGNNNGANGNLSRAEEYYMQLSQSGQFDSEYRRRNRENNPCVTHIYSMNNETDVNYVKWFPNGYCFAAGNEDGIIKLYDIRTNHCLNEFSFQESLGYVNPLHPERESNPNVSQVNRHLIGKPPMYGLLGNNHNNSNNNNGMNNNGSGMNSNNNAVTTGNNDTNGQTNTNSNMANDEDSRDRLKKGSSNFENTNELSQLQDMIEKYETDYEGVACLDFSLSGQFLFASYNGTSAILVWDVISGQIVDRLQEHNYHIPKVSMSPDGTMLAASCWDKTNYIYCRKS